MGYITNCNKSYEPTNVSPVISNTSRENLPLAGLEDFEILLKNPLYVKKIPECNKNPY